MKKLLLSALLLSAGAASAQWTEQATGFNSASRGISEIDIVDANTVWCVAYDGLDTANNIQEFTKTSDGGETWTPGFIDLGDTTLAINNISALSSDLCWVSSIDGNVGAGSLFYTDDGGTIWNFANPPGAYATAASFQNLVYFFDDQTGIVQGDPLGSSWEVYRTTDGGANWTALTSWGGALAPLSGEWGYNGGNIGINDFYWFVTNKGKIYRSADKGATWTKFSSPLADFGGSGTNGRLHFTNNTGDITTCTGVLIGTTNGGTSYSRYTTTNGGATWSAAAAYTGGYINMEFIPGTTMLVANGGAAQNYGSAYSSDLGVTWTVIDDAVQRTALAFLDGSTGWAGGFNEDDTTGGIYKYTGPSLGLPTVSNRAQFTATPNPTNGMLNVANENANITDVVVFDLLGKQVYNAKFSALNEVNLDLTPLTAGAYILTATADNGAKQTIKIMKN